MPKKTLYKVDKQGNLIFTQNDLQRARYKTETFWYQPWILLAIMIACAIVDAANFSQLFDGFLLDSDFIRYVSIGAMIIAFEVAPVYFAFSLKKYAMGYNIEKWSILIPLAAFIMAIIVNVILRIVTKDLVFRDITIGTSLLSNSVQTPVNPLPNALYYSIFFAALPLITACVSFAAAFSMANPLRDELKKLDIEKGLILEKIGQIKPIIEEYEADKGFLERLKENDDDKYSAALNMIEKKRDTYLDYVRQRINEHLSDPSDISHPVDYKI